MGCSMVSYRILRMGMLSVFIFLIGLFLPAGGQGREEFSVLVLHSYHRGLSWDEEIDRGIAVALRESGASIDLQTEYMDTKRIIDPFYLSQLYDIYRYKFRNRSFDAILCTDNNAFDFLLKYAETLFPDTPVVFCGVNNFRKESIEGHSLFTGVPEAVDIADTLDVGLKLHPNARYVAVFGDNSPTYCLNKANLLEILPRYDTIFSFLFYDDLNILEIGRQVGVLPENSLILLISTLRDEKGNLISFERSAERISGFADIPVYGFWNFFLGHGIVGGKLINGYSQGYTAAGMVLKILNGTPVAEVPVVEDIPNRYMFDYTRLARFGISMDALPSGSLVINRPDSLYSVHKKVFWLAGGGFFGLLAIIFLLTANIIHRKRAQEALREAPAKISFRHSRFPSRHCAAAGESGRFRPGESGHGRNFRIFHRGDSLLFTRGDMENSPFARPVPGSAASFRQVRGRGPSLPVCLPCDPKRRNPALDRGFRQSARRIRRTDLSGDLHGHHGPNHRRKRSAGK
jgi:ABC-type uncharacterized transport system substrate-binding protein